jgi:hypothetical protein
MPTKSPKIFKINYLDEIDIELLKMIMDMAKIKFFNKPVTYDKFFKANDLYRYDERYIITLTGQHRHISLWTNGTKIYHKDKLSNNRYLQYYNNTDKQFFNDIIISLKIKEKDSNNVIIDTKSVSLKKSKSSKESNKYKIFFSKNSSSSSGL